MGITIEAAVLEIATLSKKIAKLKKYQQRHDELQSFVQLGNKLSSNGATGGTEVEGASTVATSESPRRKKTTAVKAEDVLRANGPLSLENLLAEMINVGWPSNGNRAKEKKAVYVAMHRGKARFECGEDGRWRLRETVT